MKINPLLYLLGRSANDLKIEMLLNELGVKRRPQLSSQDYESFNYNFWLPVNKHGIEFGFRNEAALKSLNEESEKCNLFPLKLFTLIFYAGRPDIKTYESELPYGLDFNDSPYTVKKKLSDYQQYLKEHIRDVWDFPSHTLIVSYNDSRTQISDIIYMLKDEPSNDIRSIQLPPINEICNSITHSIRQPELFETYRFLDLRDYLRKKNTPDERYLPTEYGILLKFEGEDCHENPLFPDEKGQILTVVSLFRDKLNDKSRGWQGKLPFGIDFEDNPADLAEKINSRPNLVEDSDRQGYARWDFDKYSLNILYSNLMNNIAEITITPSWYT